MILIGDSDGMKDLQESRNSINEIDKEIAKLFCKRMETVKDIAEYKAANGIPVYDEGREQVVIERNSKYVDDPDIRSYYVTFLQNMMDISKAYQHRLVSGIRVAYSGVEGAFAHIAAGKIFPDAERVSYHSFDKAYNAVVNGECDLAVLPIENSFAGEVGQVTDLMVHGSLYINGVYDLPVCQNLLGVPGAKIKDITKVVSHPQALSQCGNYIKAHGMEEEQVSNTARAAQKVAELGDIHVAAIASAETADLYGLVLLDHDINESANNTTRFAVFSRIQDTDRRGNENNFIIIFTVNNIAGALENAIHVIGKYGFNMKALRSRPMKDTAFQYYFYIEAEGNELSEKGRNMIEELQKQCAMLKIVGHYGEEIKL